MEAGPPRSVLPDLHSWRQCAWQDFDCRRPSDRRRHGDPFPLPRLGKPEDTTPLNRRLDGACGALNGLASAVFTRADFSNSSLPLTNVQSWMMGDLKRRIEAYGEKPDNLTEEEALRALGVGANLYSQEAKTVVDINLGEIKILSRKLTPTPAWELAPPHVKQYLKEFTCLVERPVGELEALQGHRDLVEPYWDPQLRNDRAERFRLYQKLHSCGLLTYRRRQKARVGFFAVGKKGNRVGNTQRLIVDCRQANALQQRPPTTRLATPAGLASLDYNQDTLRDLGFDVSPECWDPDISTGDVGDCFYNFSIPEACSWFSTGDVTCRTEMQTWGIEETLVYEEDVDTMEPLSLDEPVYVCFGGMPMGWSWALWIAQEVISHQCLVAVNGNSSELVKDKHPAPPILPGAAPLGIYVDNVHCFGGRRQDAESRMSLVAQHFESLGIPFEVDERDTGTCLETLGLSFSFGSHVRVRAKPQRAWRLWLATRALLRRRRVSGEALRVWLGHVNFHFMLNRPLLACLSATYKFSLLHLGHRFPMWPSVRKELKTVMHLLFVVEHNLSAEVCEEVHVGDASDRGFGLMTCRASRERIQHEMRYEERWRFITSDEMTDTVLYPLPFPASDQADGRLHVETTGGHTMRGISPLAGVGQHTLFGKWVREQTEDRHVQKSIKRRKRQLFGRNEVRPRSVIEAIRIPPISRTWCESKRWDLVCAHAWRDPHVHINEKEAQVCLMAIRRLSRTQRNLGKKALVLSDSMVSIMALSKGRSGSRGLNNICRRTAAYVIAGNFIISYRHIRSEDNPADEPSRRFGEDFVKWDRREGLAEAAGTHLCADSFERGECRALPTMPRRFSSNYDTSPKFFLELFSGTDNLTDAVKKSGMRTLPPFDVEKDPMYDLLNPGVQAYVFDWLESGAVFWVHLGTPCTVWSRARHNIHNWKKARRKEREAVATALFSVRVLEICLRRKIMFSLENPASSRLWDFPRMTQVFKCKDVMKIQFDMCQYGETYKKTTALLTNQPLFRHLSRRCRGGHQHTHLRGGVKVKLGGQWVWRNRTFLAGAYPRQFCWELARLALQDCPKGGQGQLSWGQRNAFLGMLQEAAYPPLSSSTAIDAAAAKTPSNCAHRELSEAKVYLQDNHVLFGHHTREDIQSHVQTQTERFAASEVQSQGGTGRQAASSSPTAPRFQDQPTDA